MRKRGYALGAALGIILTVGAVFLVVSQTDQMPRVAKVWPLALGVGASLLAWMLIGLISALLAFPNLKSLRVRDMVYIYLAGAFVGGLSPVRGLEIPYEIYLLKKIGLSAGEGSTVIITRGLLNITVIILATAGVLIFSPKLPSIGSWKLLAASLGIAVAWALITALIRRRRRRASGTYEHHGSHRGWQEKIREMVVTFFADMRQSFVMLWRAENRTVLVFSGLLMLLYWGVRLSFGPLALMAGGYSGNWIPIVVAQLLLISFVLPVAPTPGGSGAAELGFAALISSHVSGNFLSSGVIIYAGLTHYLPVIVGAFFVGMYLWREAAEHRRHNE